MLEEYLADGGDVAEADRCLRELNVPTAHFQVQKKTHQPCYAPIIAHSSRLLLNGSFQFVKIAVTLALERKEADRKKISALLKAFSTSGLVRTTKLPPPPFLCGGKDADAVQVSEAHMISGFKCCVDCIGDLVKDISPNARTLLLDFISLAISESTLQWKQ